MEQEKETVESLFSQLNRLRIQERCYYEFKFICEKIEQLIRNMLSDGSISIQSAIYVQAASALSHTINKEIDFIKSYQDKMHKKNAAKVRTSEYYAAIDKAYSRVYADIMLVLMEEKKKNEG